MTKATSVSRRDFIKGSALGAGLLGLSSTPLIAREKKSTNKKTTFKHITCPRNCRDACALLLEVNEKGVAVNVTGDPRHPVTRGTPCVKGHTYVEYLYSPDRIKYPMKRVGKKGEGKFKRISWNEAYKISAKELKKRIKKHGGETVVPFVYSGNEGKISKSLAPDRFFSKIGATGFLRNPCDWSRYPAHVSVTGNDTHKDLLELKESDLIVSWGSNDAYTAVHWLGVAGDARKKGAKSVVINSIRAPHANTADLFIQVKQGTDAAFALAICKILIDELKYNREYVAKFTKDFDKLVDRCNEFTLGELSMKCGASLEEMRLFADMYSSAKAAMIISGDGSQRQLNGARLIRAINLLPVLMGFMDVRGGGMVWAYTHLGGFMNGAAHKNLAPKGPDGKPMKPKQGTSYIEIGKALQERPTSFGKPMPTKITAVINFNTNIMVTAPNTNLIKKGLLRKDMFLLVMDPFYTDACDYADIVMPGTTFMESEDIQTDQVSGFLMYNDAAVKPLFESKVNREIFFSLAKAMGFKDREFDDSSEDILREFLETPLNRKMGITYESIKKVGWVSPSRTAETYRDVWPYHPYTTTGKFKTASGKAEFYSEDFKKAGFHPVIDLETSQDVITRTKGTNYLKKYPINLCQPGSQLINNSNWCNVKYIKNRIYIKGEAPLFLNKELADSKGIEDGDYVWAYNEKGRVKFTAQIVSETHENFAYTFNNIWPRFTKSKTCVNMLTSDELSDMGQGSTYSATYVQIEKA